MDVEPPKPPGRADSARVALARRPRRRTGGPLGTIVTVGSVAAGVALLAVTWAGREAFAPPAALTVAVLLLPYLYGGLIAWFFTLWAILPDRREPPIAMGALILVAGGLWGPAWSARPESAPGDDVRVMTWNLRRLWGGPDDGGDPIACAVGVIRAQDPDVLTLLEVSRDDLDALEAQLGMSCAYTTYLESDSRKKGGLAACARGRSKLKGGGGQRFVDDEDWYYVLTEVQRDDRVFNVLAVHLYPYAFAARHLGHGVEDLKRLEADDLEALSRDGSEVVRAQSDQSAALLERVGRFRDPTIVAGDFNSTRDAALHVALRRTLTDAWERGGSGFGATIRLLGKIPLRVDYVYTSDAFAVADAQVPQVGCSDHLPVVASVVLRAEQPTVGRAP